MSDETAHEPPANPEIHFEPIVTLPAIEVKSLEDNEEEIFQVRAKLYRYVSDGEESDWKERGLGVMKILKHKERQTFRVLMRRDKTLKICANHLITKDMELKPNCGSDRAWVWNVAADFADEECKSETLAAKFGNAENATKFKDKFEECQKLLSDDKTTTKEEEQESDKLAKELEGLNVKENEDKKNDDKKEDKKEETPSEDTSSTSKENETKEQKKKEEEDVPEK